MAAITGGQPLAHDEARAAPKATSSTRMSTAKAALFTATAMKPVAGVGAPS